MSDIFLWKKNAEGFYEKRACSESDYMAALDAEIKRSLIREHQGIKGVGRTYASIRMENDRGDTFMEQVEL